MQVWKFIASKDNFMFHVLSFDNGVYTLNVICSFAGQRRDYFKQVTVDKRYQTIHCFFFNIISTFGIKVFQKMM